MENEITLEMRLEKLKEDIAELCWDFHAHEPGCQLSIFVYEIRTGVRNGTASSFDIQASATITR
jgi:hypothetical protein